MADKTISQLPQLPGNLTLDTILAVVQNGVAHKAEVGEVVDLTLDSISIVENADGTSIRIPGVNLQLCWIPTMEFTYDSGSLTATWVFPERFDEPPAVMPGTPYRNGSSVTPNLADVYPNTAWEVTGSNVTLFRWGTHGSSFQAGDTLIAPMFAIGRY